MIDKFYYLIIILASMVVIKFCYSNMNHKHRSNTLPSYKIDSTYVDAFHVDSTGKYLINWKGDTCTRKDRSSKLIKQHKPLAVNNK